MNRGVLYFLIAVVAVGIIGGAAFMASLYFQAGSGEASVPITAPELSLEENTAADTAESTTSDTGDRRLFRIAQEESVVRFELDEELLGSPKHVVGTTDQVAGDIVIDFSNPANSEVGTIRINARTFTTDNEFRNRAIRGQILQSAQDEFEFIEFRPTVLEGLPTTGELGTTYEFTITGDLQIRDVVQPVTFNASVTLVDETRLEGTAQATVLRSDFGLTIPDVPSVANVTDEVVLTIEFVAPEVAG
ncbi:MAG: hypothetical protein Kow0077_14560 [Anaerolineae bacterium]